MPRSYVVVDFGRKMFSSQVLSDLPGLGVE